MSLFIEVLAALAALLFLQFPAFAASAEAGVSSDAKADRKAEYAAADKAKG